jgi:hypothetical protein
LSAQAGIVFRYFRIDASHDVSGDVLALSLDGVTFSATGVTYIAPGAYPASVTAANSSKPPASGFTGYWWRVLTGPGQPLALQRGSNIVYGQLTDSPEVPRFSWRVSVDASA